MRRFLAILSFLLLSLVAFPASRTEIRGRVMLNGEEKSPGDYVMVYCKEFGTGVLSDENGWFSIRIPSAGPKKVKLEYSRIGYDVLMVDYEPNGGTVDAGEILLEPQTLMLMAAYVVPDGMSPSEYILSKVWETTRKNRKKKFNYRAEINYKVTTHELPVVAKTLPKAAVGLAKMFGSFQGYGPMIRYCLKNDDFSAKASLSRSVKDGKKTDFAHKLLWSDKPLPENVKENVTHLFDFIDLYDIMYDDASSYAEKFTGRHKFKLVGTYEYDGRLVDVLSWTDYKGRVTANLHVVEEKWTFMKLQVYTKEGEVLRCEAREIGNGVYMPVSMLMKPSVTMVRNSDIPVLMDEVRKNKSLTKGSRERMLKVLESKHSAGEDFNPYISISGSCRYRVTQ